MDQADEISSAVEESELGTDNVSFNIIVFKKCYMITFSDDLDDDEFADLKRNLYDIQKICYVEKIRNDVMVFPCESDFYLTKLFCFITIFHERKIKKDLRLHIAFTLCQAVIILIIIFLIFF